MSVFVGVLFGSSGGSVGNGISPPKAAPPPPPPPQKRIQVHPSPRGQMIRGTMWPFDSVVLEVVVPDRVEYWEYVVC